MPGPRTTALLLVLAPALAAGESDPPTGPVDGEACVTCHAERNPGLVAAWRGSAHGGAEPTAGCPACHGKRHDRHILADARRNRTCKECHRGTAVATYRTSKHGAIYRQRADGWDWSRPLERGAYRTPGCAYCHLHAGNHDASATVPRRRPTAPPAKAGRERARRALSSACGNCHSPRFATEQLDASERMLGVARRKMAEAAAVMRTALREFPGRPLPAMRERLAAMRLEHLRALRLGLGHQSPDYQWWHGQAALDGDLIRLKARLSRLRRQQAAERAGAGEHPPAGTDR